MAFPVDNIRQACKRKGITLAQLERKIGIGNGVIARWETQEKSPPYDRLVKIAAALDTTVEELSQNTDPAPAESQSGITGKEWELVRLFRVLPEDLQSDVLAQLRGVLERRGLLPKQS